VLLFGEESGLSCTNEAHQRQVSFCKGDSRRRWTSVWEDSHEGESSRHAYQGGSES